MVGVNLPPVLILLGQARSRGMVGGKKRVGGKREGGEREWEKRKSRRKAWGEVEKGRFRKRG